MLRVLSLGAGVQSSTLALMMAAREIETVQAAVFADVGAEPASVYRWLEKRGYPRPPRSACTFCPYRTDEQWQQMKSEEPEAFADAVAIDESIRGGYINNSFALYVHRSQKPLAEVDFRSAEDMGQINMFNNECEGMCGV